MRQDRLWRNIGDMAAIRRPSPTRNKKGRGIKGLAMAIQALDMEKVERQTVGGEWAIMRDRRIAEMGCACEACSVTLPDTSIVQFHHIIPRAIGGQSAEKNGVLLCPTCHQTAHWVYRDSGAIPSDRAELLEWLARVRQKAA